MECKWLRINNSISKAIEGINQIDNNKFEAFQNRILSSINLTAENIFTDDELTKLQKIFKKDGAETMLVIKTSQYVLRRLLKFVFKPVCLKNDLKTLGFSEEKCNILLRLWCSETKDVLNASMSNCTDQHLEIKWNLSAELSSDICKKAKVAKANLNITDSINKMDVELIHEDLYKLFLNLEAVQVELDTLL